MINKDLIYNAKGKLLLVAFLIFCILSSEAIAPQGIGSGFAESVGTKKVNESTNATIGSGFAESIDGNESSNATINESSNATMQVAENATGSGFAKSIDINETNTKSWWQFW
jgi:hypothetical protein